MRLLRSLPRRAHRRRSLRALPLGVGAHRICTSRIRLPEQHHAPASQSKTVTRIFSSRARLANCMSEKVSKHPKLVTVSERNPQSAAVRLLPKSNRLVSTEVDYLRRVLGDRATQNDIDEKVELARKLPWSKIVGD